MNYQMNVQPIDDISWILEAAHETMNATEKDFEAIRSKKWYKRLWETVTFSKDNQIKMAKGVSSLSKLQEIMIRLLVVLSQNSTEISNAVRQNSDLINRLSITDALLLRQIDKIRFGGTSQIDFSDIGREKKALIASLLIFADPTAQRNDYSKQYISSILRAANMTAFDNTVKPEAVDSLDREEQELLYRMIMIDRYLMDADFDEPSEIVDWISVNPKRKKEIKYSIINTACAVSPEFFVTYYEKTNYIFEVVSAEDIWFEGFDNDVEIDATESLVESIDPSEYKNLILSNILHIPQGVTQRFEYKNIHVQTIIDCEGNLEFSNCTIHYGENDKLCEIKVRKTGALSMNNCTIEGHSFSEHFFIVEEADTGSNDFVNCQFVNCSYCMCLDNAFLLEQCIIINPSIYFIKSCTEQGTIKNSTFRDQEIPEFIVYSRKKSNRGAVACNNLILESSSICGFLHIDSAEMATIERNTFENFCFFESRNITISESSFAGIESLLHGAGVIKNCRFQECRNIANLSLFDKCIEFQECTFDRCTSIGKIVANGSKITHCKFNQCYNELFSTGIYGGVSIEYCEFTNWTTVDTPSVYNEITSLYNLSHQAMLSFHKSKSNDSRLSEVSNCIFGNINAHHYFLIKGDVHEKISGYVVVVDNCSFSDCTTTRPSGKIIREYGHYFGLFNKQIDLKTVSIRSNCRGLDSIKKMPT